MGICCDTYKKNKYSKRSQSYNPERKVSVSKGQQVKYVSLTPKRNSDDFSNKENISPKINSNQIYNKDDYFSSNFEFSPVSTEANDPKSLVTDSRYEKLENKEKSIKKEESQKGKNFPTWNKEKETKLISQRNELTR